MTDFHSRGVAFSVTVLQGNLGAGILVRVRHGFRDVGAVETGGGA